MRSGYLTIEEHEKEFPASNAAGRCQSCRFWEEYEPSNWGEDFGDYQAVLWDGACHRYPPSKVNAPEGDSESEYFPQTSGADWCGEYQPNT